MPFGFLGALASPFASATGSLLNSSLGGITGSDKAAEAQQRGLREAMGAQDRGLDRSLSAFGDYYARGSAALQPWQQAGGRALGDYERHLASNQDLDLAIGRDQAFNAINAKAGGRGNFYSSGRAKALGTATAGYLAAREQRRFDRLGQLAGFGANAAQQQAGMAQGFGGLAGQAYGNHANALGAAHQGIGQAQANQATAGWQNALGAAQVAASFVKK